MGGIFSQQSDQSSWWKSSQPGPSFSLFSFGDSGRRRWYNRPSTTYIYERSSPSFFSNPSSSSSILPNMSGNSGSSILPNMSGNSGSSILPNMSGNSGSSIIPNMSGNSGSSPFSANGGTRKKRRATRKQKTRSNRRR